MITSTNLNGEAGQAQVAVGPDGRRAYLSGGYLLEAGAWDGVTVVDIDTGRVLRELRVPARPLGIAVLP